MSIESDIKNQYSKVFDSSDWMTFKLMADFYFENSAKILKKDISIKEPFKLMARNIQKRLFIGIGTELLLKSLFLKNDYCINKVKKKKIPNPNKPTKFNKIPNLNILNPADTYTLNSLIENISEVITSSNNSDFEKGLKTAKVFRNKEGHVAVLWHKADRQNYTDIENCITEIYDKGFDEKLNFKISFLDGESAIFSKNK
ncbi:hypothetical protein [Haloflavibacter putidus]|uniref:Uncharacterized protein n=1 Tax=Haloflavibacter putidus TaxID=2576776 RepID=A0A507ZDN6_9FLAO|nr:hypothetical protein [Haloflavibacter putidus]TQD34028.1 hypothetical protein FKR84_12470 [Haloflavibacter putidus]